jgi:hypothetical protein
MAVMQAKLSRRQLAAALMLPAGAQPAQAPAASPSSDKELDAAKTNLLEYAKRLRSCQLPVDIEPAFQFKP